MKNMTAVTDKQYRVFALVDAGHTDRLRQVMQVVAIVHFAGVGLQLTVVVANKSQKAALARLESVFNVPGLCELIAPSDLSTDLLRKFDLALAPAGPVDKIPALALVKACGMPIIVQESVAGDLGGDANCITVPTDLKRHFASVLYQSLTMPGKFASPGITMKNGE